MPLHITDTLACWVADSRLLVMEGSLVGGGVEWITWIGRYKVYHLKLVLPGYEMDCLLPVPVCPDCTDVQESCTQLGPG